MTGRLPQGYLPRCCPYRHPGGLHGTFANGPPYRTSNSLGKPHRAYRALPACGYRPIHHGGQEDGLESYADGIQRSVRPFLKLAADQWFRSFGPYRSGLHSTR